MSALILLAAPSQFFFEPIQFDLQLPDLSVEFFFQGLFPLGPTRSLVREHVGHLVQRLFLPSDDLIGMNAKLGGDLVDC